jgi:aspartate aminotransferase
MAMLCLVEEGDEVLLPAPYWVSYAAQARACGAEVRLVDATGTDDLKPTPELLEEAVSERSRLLVLNSPCNPSGAVLSRDEMAALVEAALAHDLWIIADEIYEKLIYDGAVHVSPGSLSEEAAARVVTINGFSKTYAMTGWRVGYAAGPPELMRAAAGLQSNMTSAPNSIAQRAALEALEGPQDSVEDMREAFATRRRVMVDGLNEVAGVECLMPGGAFYAFADCGGLLGRSFNGKKVEDSVELAEVLLEQTGVAAVPGSVFGAEGYLRFHYAASEDTIRRAMERLAEFAQG